MCLSLAEIMNVQQALTISVLALPMTACSSNGAPSNSDVKKLVLTEYGSQIPDQAVKDILKVNYTECEATETEDEDFCIVSTSLEYEGEKEKDTRGWKLTKANKEWFLRGPIAISRADRENSEAN